MWSWHYLGLGWAILLLLVWGGVYAKFLPRRGQQWLLYAVGLLLPLSLITEGYVTPIGLRSVLAEISAWQWVEWLVMMTVVASLVAYVGRCLWQPQVLQPVRLIWWRLGLIAAVWLGIAVVSSSVSWLVTWAWSVVAILIAIVINRTSVAAWKSSITTSLISLVISVVIGVVLAMTQLLAPGYELGGVRFGWTVDCLALVAAAALALPSVVNWCLDQG